MDNLENGGTAIVAALHAEARTARPLARAGCRVVACGVGPERARRAASALLAAGTKRLLIWGTAAGLEPGLEAGTLLLPAAVIDPQGRRWAPDAGWHAALAARIPAGITVSETTLLTVEKPIANPGSKKALGEAAGAGAVDMETAAIAALAAAHGARFAVVRAIADPLDLPLPPVVLAAVSNRFLTFEVALRLLARPQDVRMVFALGGAMRRACRSLHTAAGAIATMT